MHDGTSLSRDGVRIIPDGDPVVIRRRRPNHQRADGLIPDWEEEHRRNEEARRRAREHRLHGTGQ